MHFAPNVAHLPPMGAYYIHDHQSIGWFMCRLISLCFPESICLGILDDFTECAAAARRQGVPVVAFAPEAFANGADGDADVRFLPLPFGNHSSYLDFGQMLLEAARTGINGRIELSEAAYNRLLMIYRIVKPVENTADFDCTERYPYFHNDWVRDRINSIEFIRRYLSDQNSKDAFNRIVYGDSMAYFDHYINSFLYKTQYLDYLTLNGDSVILNCGVDNGWELPYLLCATPTPPRVYNVDPSGCDALTPYARAFADLAGTRFSFHRCAVWDKTATLSFADNAVHETAEDEMEGGVPVSATSIDDFCRDNDIERLDVIKMDLEGAEERAILGMAETIGRFRPQLAISVYHKIEDYIDIPESIINKTKDYNYYMDMYSYDSGEVAFYAIPREIDDINRRIAQRLPSIILRS